MEFGIASVLRMKIQSIVRQVSLPYFISGHCDIMQEVFGRRLSASEARAQRLSASEARTGSTPREIVSL